MTYAALPRPTLLPGLIRLWRDRHTLQLGLDPARAVLLEVANPGTARLLDLLDGRHSQQAIIEHAARLRIVPEDARHLIETLRTAGLVLGAHTLLPASLPEPARQRLTAEAAAIALCGSDAPATPAQILRRRSAARVVVTGAGRLGGPVAVALAQAGVGHVHPDLAGQVEPADLVGAGLSAADVRRPRAEAVAEMISRVAPGTETGPVRRGEASLIVLAGMDRPAGLLATGYARRRQAHLLMALRDGTAVIGPLVPPAGSPCLNCLDLHRQDRDPGWPELAAQLAGVRSPEPCRAATLLAAVAHATAEVLTHLDGGTPETVGAAIEISSPGRLRRRVWPPHPDCGCSRRPRRRMNRPGNPHTGRHDSRRPESPENRTEW